MKHGEKPIIYGKRKKNQESRLIRNPPSRCLLQINKTGEQLKFPVLVGLMPEHKVKTRVKLAKRYKKIIK